MGKIAAMQQMSCRSRNVAIPTRILRRDFVNVAGRATNATVRRTVVI